ncbi:MAG: DUF4296 domain-containing protein [Bacteroidales bacterium]|jgi:hypothetical protein|nr:DUF4296 domain-containing protein [Bacteroidales bacterium]MDD3701099.1 DUF4296 domain-containing protein [Bacteroidales bacterium]MDY0368546.1 DUF4296 domain-containing protein [Bacteroidales bacterium]
MKQYSLQYSFVGQLVMWGCIVLLLGLASCLSSPAKEHTPSVLLSQNQMTELLMDIHIAEAALNFKRNLGQAIHEEKQQYFDAVFRNHGLTQELFEENLNYYNRFPDKMEVMYDSITKRLERMQSETEQTLQGLSAE